MNTEQGNIDNMRRALEEDNLTTDAKDMIMRTLYAYEQSHSDNT